jgi:hypothetical protein
MARTPTKSAAATKRRGRSRAEEPEEKTSSRESAQDAAAARRAAKEEANAILGAKVYELREDDEMSWGAIAEELGFGDGNQTGILQFRYEEELVRRNPRLKITAKNDDELGRKILKARDDDSLSWAKIMARTGLGLARVRNLYDDAGGTALGNRIGKGGRHPGSAAPAKAKATKRGTAAKAAKPATTGRARRSRAR